jgi:hypothetical protein
MRLGGLEMEFYACRKLIHFGQTGGNSCYLQYKAICINGLSTVA